MPSPSTIEMFVLKISQRLIIKNIINLLLFLIPISIAVVLFKFPSIFTVMLFLILLIACIYIIKKYKNTTIIDNTLNLNGLLSTYYKYKTCQNPFVSKLVSFAEEKLKSIKLSILPSYQLVGMSVILSLFIISLHISKEEQKLLTEEIKNPVYQPFSSQPASTHKNKRKTSTSTTNIKNSVSENHGFSLTFPNNILKQKDKIFPPVKNNISKREKEFIESLTGENTLNR